MTFAGLFGSELRRLLARRAVRMALVVALGIAALVVVVAIIRSTGTAPGDHTMRLRTLWLERGGHNEETTLLSVSIYLFILVVAIAATAIGGDYRAGTIGTPLTWEPRRVRLASARLLALTTVAVGLYLVVIGVLVGGWSLGAAVRGSTAGLPTHFWSDILRLVARCVAVTAGFAVVTAGLVLLTRSTVGGILVWFGYLVGVEGVLASRISGLREKLLFANLAAFLDGHDVSFTATGSVRSVVVGPSDGLGLLVAVAVAVAVLGVLAFSRRDVT